MFSVSETGAAGEIGAAKLGASGAAPGGSTRASCPVCLADSVSLDAVERAPRDWMQLAECAHCDHRWTRPLPESARPSPGPRFARPLVDADEEDEEAAQAA